MVLFVSVGLKTHYGNGSEQVRNLLFRHAGQVFGFLVVTACGRCMIDRYWWCTLTGVTEIKSLPNCTRRMFFGLLCDSFRRLCFVIELLEKRTFKLTPERFTDRFAPEDRGSFKRRRWEIKSYFENRYESGMKTVHFVTDRVRRKKSTFMLCCL